MHIYNYSSLGFDKMVERIRNVIKSDRKKGVEAPESEPVAKRSKNMQIYLVVILCLP